MTLISGVIKEIAVEGGMPIARVSVDGTLLKVPLVFVKDAVVGDAILISSGIAISRIQHQRQSEDASDVSGDTGKNT